MNAIYSRNSLITENSIINIEKLKGLIGKKALVFGLGVLGGGVSSTNWLLSHDADVTVTDLKSKEELLPSLRCLKERVKLRLDEHVDKDILENDVIVFNPDIPILSPYVTLAKKHNKCIENEATIFYKLCNIPIIAVTGTRGKTTTSAWIAHFLDVKYSTIQAGNSPSNPLLKTLQFIEEIAFSEKKDKNPNSYFVINELPSYHLEYFRLISKAPDIAVITNISPDHLNRHPSLKDYVDTKANIFLNQNKSQQLVLNYENKWTEYLIRKQKESKTWVFSKSVLPRYIAGIYYENGAVYFQDTTSTHSKKVLDIGNFHILLGEHNLENLLASSMVAHLSGINWQDIKSRIQSLPQIPFRQEVVFSNDQITIINDNAATSPEGSIPAIKRFGSSSCLIITGGTDKQLDYSEWAEIIKNYVPFENIFFLEGSATDKMISILSGYLESSNVFGSLSECVNAALKFTRNFQRATIVFSPAAKSFEKFTNEFERGKVFDEIINKEVKGGINTQRSL